MNYKNQNPGAGEFYTTDDKKVRSTVSISINVVPNPPMYC